MDKIWEEMLAAALKVQNGRQISRYVEAGGVAAAVLSDHNLMYAMLSAEKPLKNASLSVRGLKSIWNQKG